ncbi:MAG: manganese-dependent inorganic pyrophosphatase [Lactobacillales bacterium]|jgi:manganese-dependent inorganic pyrophosphatase|nr:manganese-dependent inorganic pyrophosphatase [Lactobacillales bacterium]
MSKTIVFGHQNPDTDTITAAISLAHLIGAEPVALGATNEETQYALKEFGHAELPIIKNIAETGADSVWLVDHNEAQQSAADIKDFDVAGVVDHHRIANFETANPLFYRAEPVGCTNTIIHKLYVERGVEIPANIAGLMLSAIISDTLLFKSPTTTEEDIKAAHALAAIANVNIELYGLELLKAGTNLAAKTESELLNSDVKSFPMGDQTIRIGQVNTVSIPEVLDRKAALIAEMEKENAANGFDQFILIITDILESNSEAIVVGGDTSKIESAFNTPVNADVVVLPGVVSRKKQVVPQLTDAYNA